MLALTPRVQVDVGTRCGETASAPEHRAPRPVSLRLVAEMHDATEEYLETILELEEEGITPIRARLVERLGVSAPAVSETVNRLVGGGYTELLDDRSLRLTTKGRDARHLGRAPPPARRAAPRRRDRPRVGEGPPRGRPLGARDLGRRRGEARRSCSATRPRARTATRSRAPKHKADAAAPTPLDAESTPGPVEVARISEKIELDDDALNLLADAQLIPGHRADRRRAQARTA